jgi:glycosyltransferase
MDTGENIELSEKISKSLRMNDVHIKERDQGIFDALNKGLNISTAKWIGWIGADDLLSLNFNPKHILNVDETCNIVSYSTFFYSLNTQNILRVYRPVKSKLLRKMGAHLPHFSTYVRLEAVKSFRFDITKRNFADQIYFFELEKLYNVKILKDISTYMASGGSSNESFFGILSTNKKVFTAIKEKTNAIHAFVYIGIKIIYKIIQKFIKPDKEESEAFRVQMKAKN